MAGGQEPFSWRLTAPLDGWSVAPDPEDARGVMLRTAQVQGTVAVGIEVTDGTGRVAERTFELAPRQSCWFAYSASGANGPELHLLDPLLDLETTELEHATAVYDFQFSPDGRYLAYRFGQSVEAPRGAHVALVDLKTLDEQVLSFNEERIIAYAWSSDSSVLAVAFNANAVDYLGAVVMPASGEDPLMHLASIPAFVGSELHWVGNRFVAYHAALLPHPTQPGEFQDNPYQRRTAFYSELSGGGFSPQQMFGDDSFTAGVTLQPNSDGFYMIEPLAQTTTFFPLTSEESPGYHHSVSLVAPSGDYSATFDAGLPRMYSAVNGTWSVPVATGKAGEDCPLPLAWARGRERIACLADVGQHGEVRFFDLDSSSEWLESFTLGGFCADDVAQVTSDSCTTQEQGYGYASAQARQAARGFSASGRWFAFAAVHEGKAFLYASDLEQAPDQLGSHYSFRQTETTRPVTRLSFSSDERFLLFQHGSALDLHELATSNTSYRLSDELPTGQLCSEDFPSAPDRYCGNSERSAAFRWAPDTTALAFRAAGSVSVVDVTDDTSIVTHSLAAPECADECANGFAFQP